MGIMTLASLNTLVFMNHHSHNPTPTAAGRTLMNYALYGEGLGCADLPGIGLWALELGVQVGDGASGRASAWPCPTNNRPN